jgi:hypothetical protein
MVGPPMMGPGAATYVTAPGGGAAMGPHFVDPATGYAYPAVPAGPHGPGGPGTVMYYPAHFPHGAAPMQAGAGGGVTMYAPPAPGSASHQGTSNEQNNAAAAQFAAMQMQAMQYMQYHAAASAAHGYGGQVQMVPVPMQVHGGSGGGSQSPSPSPVPQSSAPAPSATGGGNNSAPILVYDGSKGEPVYYAMPAQWVGGDPHGVYMQQQPQMQVPPQMQMQPGGPVPTSLAQLQMMQMQMQMMQHAGSGQPVMVHYPFPAAPSSGGASNGGPGGPEAQRK